MVDVSAKSVTTRSAVAHAFVRMAPSVVRAVRHLKNPKGNSAGSGADSGDRGSQTHRGVDTSLSPAALTHIAVTARLCKDGVEIPIPGNSHAQTGVEMEALVAAACAALTSTICAKLSTKG